MTLDKLILKNFLTYKDLEYEFEKRPLLVQGLNLTDEKQKTNGTGKSGIQTGIEFCMTASNSRDVRDAELVTYDHKEANTQLFASCDIRKQKLHIDWTIKVKGSNTLRLKTKQYGEGEWSDVSFSNVNDGKKFISEWFALSREDLFNYYIINKTRFKSFFKSSNREKVDLINRFSDASIIKGLEDIDKEELELKFSNSTKAIDNSEGAIEQLKIQIEKEENRNLKQENEEKKEKLLEEIEEIEDDINDVEIKIRSEKGSIISLEEEDIKNSEEDIATAKLGEIDINKDIENSSAAVIKAQMNVDDAQKLVDEFESTNWDGERGGFEEAIEEFEETVEELEEEDKKLLEKETKLLKFIQKVEVVLGGAIICPSCSHEFLLDGSIDLGEQKKKKNLADRLKIQLGDSKEGVSSAIFTAKGKIKGIEEEVSKINKKEELENRAKNLLIEAVTITDKNLTAADKKLNSHRQELKTLTADMNDYKNDIKAYKASIIIIEGRISNYGQEITNLNTKISDLNDKIKDLSVGSNKALISSLKKDLRSLELKIEDQKKESSKIGDEIYNTNQWINNFKQFRTFLANQSLEIIEYHCNRYLIDMGSDLRVKMEGFKTLANGTIKEEISAKVIRNRERTFSSFSGGEQGRLLFASILANRHMINETHPYGGLDFLNIDEVFEGVDSVGLKYLIESAKTLNIPVMIITHVTDEEASSDRILVVKENGTSTIQK